MGNVKKEDRADGTEILKLNLVGLGLQAIGELVGCHEATVSVKLKEMGVAPNDTRRNFMGEVYSALPEETREWLADTLYTTRTPIKDFVVQLLKEAHRNSPEAPAPEPTPLPSPSHPLTEGDQELVHWEKVLKGEDPGLASHLAVVDRIMGDLFNTGSSTVSGTVEDGRPEVTLIPPKKLFDD